MPDSTEQPPFPIPAIIAGIAVVTIPLTEYAALLECRRREKPCAAPAAARRYDVPPRSPLERDAEIAAFFSERFGAMDVLDIIAECRNRFGAKRTPSRTAAYYFWKRLRTKAANRPPSTCPGNQ